VISFLTDDDITDGDFMAQLIVRRLDDAAKERLRARARKHGRSLEAEARAILEDAAGGQPRDGASRKKAKGFGTLMHERFKKIGLTDEEYAQSQKGIDELNRNRRTQTPRLDEERTKAAAEPGFGTRASARFKGIGFTRRELDAFNRAVDKRRKERPRLAKIDR
jgi:plasmid stability protein